MDDVRAVLRSVEVQVHARPDALVRVRGARRRRRRTRHVARAALAVVVLIGAGAAGLTFRSALQRDVVAAPVVDPEAVQHLAPSWQQVVDGSGSSALAVAGGTVFVAADDGTLHALDARTGAVRWVGRTAPGAPTTPVAADGVVLEHVGGRLFAFSVDCANGGECLPRWTATTGGGNEGSPTVAGGVAYVVASPGGVMAFSLDCRGPCPATWTAPDPAGHVAHAPAVSDGIVWDSSAHALSAFAATCASTGATCRAIVAGLRPAGADLVSAPVVADGVLYVGAGDGTLYAVSTACARGGACDVLWHASTGGSIVATPVVAGGRVYVGSTDGFVYAFAARCPGTAGSCGPLWFGRTGAPIKEQPVAANGVVYVASTDGRLYAYASACGTDGRSCAPLAVRSIGALPPSPSTWFDRAVLTVSAEGTVTAWTVNGAGLGGVR